MSTAALVLQKATSQLGYREGPKNNETKYATWFGRFQFEPWCAMFVSWVAKMTGTKGIPHTASTLAGVRYFKRHGRWHEGTAGIRRGDIIYFRWQRGDRVRHVGIVESVRGRDVICIEGNTQPGRRGNQSDGGGVRRRVRRADVIAGYGRPLYSEVAAAPKAGRFLFMGSEGDDVLELQKLLGFTEEEDLDGIFGPITRQRVIDYQTIHGLLIDGVVGPETLGHLQRNQRVAWQLDGPGNNELTSLLQHLVTKRGRPTKIDGVFGNDTRAAVKVIQRNHKLPETGVADRVTWDRLCGV